MSGFSFNPNAASFSFNASAASFNPTSFTLPTNFAPAPPAVPAPVAPEAPKEESAHVSAEIPSTVPEVPAVVADESSSEDESPAVAVVAAPVKIEKEKKEFESRPKPTQASAAPPPVKDDKPRLPADPRSHLNIVFIGHVDAGKSTTCGNILYLSGNVDQRTMEKYEREAKEKNRDSWFLAFIMDTSEEERAKGKTVEVGRAHFNTNERRFTILDAPGHKGYVPNMIAGASQADVAILIISARKGEFEAGFEKGGQTREHIVLAKTLGVSQMVVAVNKMDDPSVDWNQARYDDIQKKTRDYFKSVGYNPAEVIYLPISGLNGHNLLHHAADKSNPKFCEKSTWYGPENPTLLNILNTVKLPERPSNPVRFTILDGYKDQGVVALGKVEAGTIKFNDVLTLMPGKTKVRVAGVAVDDGEGEIDYIEAGPGENVALRLVGVEEEQVQKGMILCGGDKDADLCPVVSSFKATVALVDLDPNSILAAGYRCVMHAHTAVENIQVMKLHSTLDKTTRMKKENPPFARNNQVITCTIAFTENPMCLETFTKNPQLGRFTLRDNTKTIAIGKIDEIIKAKE
eukprot:GDKJ01023369.1.p1 GENE.GDKJ01023369.1~~GDKJ01023369.1.p1  ORF type:complete len:574 (-),score=193.81 GDKJ01023369.1:155-1876(-)